ncbi:universal stress protein [Mastigocladopsis repens]|uniref:universal stress protein n=1 Tax=Mastigocladopsis repens TaxID=221287 RepID=UPI0003041227|nr:universal stress protein [Mastigocladopsis repens]
MFHKILVALDNSEIGQHIFDEALSLAKAVHGNVMLLHILSPFDGGYLNPVLLQPNGVYSNLHTEAVNKYMQQWEQLKQQRLDMLRSFAEQANKAGVITEFSQNLGDPGQVICEVARNWQADLIIVGRRGRRGLSEFFLGSVSNYVLHNASCSVLTVQGPIHGTTEAPQVTHAASA